MSISPTKKGELYIFAEAILWSLFPVLTILSFDKLTPLFSASLSTLVSSLFFGIMLTLRKRWHELTVQAAWKDILLTSLLIGVVFYGLVFTALKYTTAGNAAIMGQMEVFFSFLILGVLWQHEKIIIPHVIGGVLMVVGALLILLPYSSGWHGGDLLVILAAAIAP